MPGPFQTLQSAAGGPSGPPAQALTDEQIAQLRQYAGVLQGNKQPVQHWLQGASNLTGDIVGALQQRKADQAAQQRQQQTTGYVAGQAAPPPYAPPQGAPYAPVAPPQPAPASPPAMAPPPYAQPNTDWSNPQPAAIGGLYNTGMQPGAQPLQTGDFAPDPSMMSTG